MHISRLSLLIGLSLLISPLTQLWAGDFTRPTAVLERGGDKTILITVNLKKLTTTDLDTLKVPIGDTEAVRVALIRLLDICSVASATEECGASAFPAQFLPEKELDETPETQRSPNLFAEVLPNSITMVADPDLITQNVQAQIRLTNQDAATAFTTATKLSFKITYSTVPEAENGVEVTTSKAISQTPEGVGAIGSKSSLTATWKKLDTVTTEGGGSAAPSGMLAILIPENLFEAPDFIPSVVYNADFEQQTIKDTCDLTVAADRSSCSIACGSPPEVIDEGELGRFSSDGVVSLTSSGSTVTFNNLDNAKTYAIILQYQPDGLNRSCVIGKPNDALILTELTTGRVPKSSDSYCFIATAAYGSTLHAHLNTLRWFRNEFLLPYAWGMDLVRAYYRFGPEAAAYIADKPALKTLVRGALWTPVTYIESYRLRPGLTLAMTLLGFSLLTYLAFRRAKRDPGQLTT